MHKQTTPVTGLVLFLPWTTSDSEDPRRAAGLETLLLKQQAKNKIKLRENFLLREFFKDKTKYRICDHLSCI